MSQNNEKKQSDHQKLANRLGDILVKLNNGERLSKKALAEEFGVSVRSIERDFKERLTYLPYEQEKGYYYLKKEHLGEYDFKSLKEFADFNKIGGLYPDFDQSMVSDIFNKEVNKTINVKGHNFEDMKSKRKLFDSLGGAIKIHQVICCTYNDKKREIEPYKLRNVNGIWYLIGVEDSKLKHFAFNKLKNTTITEESFVPNDDILEILEDDENVWFTQEQIEVEIFVDASVAEYFLRRPLLPHQTLLESREDGLVLSTKVAYEEEILRLVRYWIPHLRIVSPDSLLKQLNCELKNYLAL